jgi:hypothetical protein
MRSARGRTSPGQTIFSALESRYSVFIDVDEIVADNFCNLAAIKAILTRKGIKL